MRSSRYPEPPDDGDDDIDLSGVAYFEQVERALVAAAASHGAPRTPRRDAALRPVALAGAAAGVLLVALVALQSGGREQTADAIDVRRLDGETVIVVDELIDDPRGVERELDAAGIPAALQGALAPPPLIGAVVAVTQEAADDSLDVDVTGVDADGDGAIERIVIPDGFRGAIDLIVGVAADDDLDIVFAAAPAGCEDLVGATVEAATPGLEVLSDGIVWFRYTADGQEVLEEGEVPPPDDVVVDVQVTGDSDLLVTTADEPDRLTPATPPCGA